MCVYIIAASNVREQEIRIVRIVIKITDNNVTAPVRVTSKPFVDNVTEFLQNIRVHVTEN